MSSSNAERPRPGPKPTLSSDALVEAALALVDEEGLGALNLRKLAARVGVSPMTPYSYFESKAELLDAMIDHALAPLGDHLIPTAPWHEQLAAAMRAMHAAVEEHPGVLDLLMNNHETTRLEAFRGELLGMLMAAGLTREQSGDALRALTAYVLGYAVVKRLRRQPAPARHSVDPFEHGLELLMASIRAEAP